MISQFIQIIEETGSTNADLAERARDNAVREGQWLVARRQSAGRGRQGREWFDGSGNFMGSTAVRIESGDPPPSTIGFVTALAVSEAVKRTGGAGLPSLKWPNDVLWEGAKLAGILMERVGDYVIVGIGVNLSVAPVLEDRRSVAMSDFGTAPILDTFAETLALEFASWLEDWRRYGFERLLREFQHRSIHKKGSLVKVHDTDGSRVEGAFDGLEEIDGALRLRLADGSQRVIRAGDIL